MATLNTALSSRIVGLLSYGYNAREVVELCKGTVKQEFVEELVANPDIQHAVERRQLSALHNSLIETADNVRKSIQELTNIIGDEKISPKFRLEAMRTAVELAKFVRHDVDLNERLAELQFRSFQRDTE